MGASHLEEPFAVSVFGDTRGSLYALDVMTGAQRWKCSLGTGSILAPPTVANGFVYVGTTGGSGSPTLAAVEAKTGKVVWQIEAPGDVGAAPVVLADEALAMTGDGWLHAYSVKDGKARWNLNVLYLTRGRRARISGLVYRDGVLYLTTSEGVGAVDVARRTVLWGRENEFEFPYPPAVTGRGVFCAREDGEIRALSVADGSQLWSFDRCGVCNSQPQLIGGVVVFGSETGNLFGLDAESGEEIWRLDFPGAEIRSFIYEGGNLFVVGNSPHGAVYRYDLQLDEGDWKWRKVWEAPLAVGAQSDPLLYGSEVILTAGDARVYSFDRLNGKPRWFFKPMNVAVAAAELVAGGTRLPSDRTFDRCCWLGAHNAFANSKEGWMIAQQGRSILEQLDAGVRMLMLDVWACGPLNPAVVYAHGNCLLTRAQMYPLSPWVLFEDSLGQIVGWLQRNPFEIVTVVLEQRVYNKEMLLGAIERSGAMPWIFWADRPNPGPGGSWNVGTSGWPPLGWMRTADKRLVLFSDHIRGMGREDDGLPYVWNWCVENEYGSASRQPSCKERSGSKPISDASKLFIQNYQVDLSENWSDFDELNDSERILHHVGICRTKHNRLPNFLAVDWAEFGNHGGPMRAVLKVNSAL